MRARSLQSLLIVSSLTAATALAQNADINQPRQREAVLEPARTLLNRPAPPTPPADTPNPFVAKAPAPVDATPPVETTTPTLPARALDDIAFLTTLANRIPATGTVNLGGVQILLLGSKRYRAGDKLTIDFEGTPHELELVEIAPTNFTVKRGPHQITRALRLTTPPPTSGR